jgi:alpha-tubulin suppressor-like RCC1 family protein
MKHVLITVPIVFFITNIAIASAWREHAEAIDISGGEDHTLVLTANKCAWGCGDNYYYQLGIGTNVSKCTLVRVAKGDMNSTSDYLENIDDVAAG